MSGPADRKRDVYPSRLSVAGNNRYRRFDRHDYRALLRELEQPDADIEAIREKLADYDPIDVARWYRVGRKELQEQVEWADVQMYNLKAEVEHQKRLRQRAVTAARRCMPNEVAQRNEKRCANPNCKRRFVARKGAKTCSTRCRTALHRRKEKASRGRSAGRRGRAQCRRDSTDERTGPRKA
jgi:hypothetical protein